MYRKIWITLFFLCGCEEMLQNAVYYRFNCTCFSEGLVTSTAACALDADHAIDSAEEACMHSDFCLDEYNRPACVVSCQCSDTQVNCTTASTQLGFPDQIHCNFYQ